MNSFVGYLPCLTYFPELFRGEYFPQTTVATNEKVQFWLVLTRLPFFLIFISFPAPLIMPTCHLTDQYLPEAVGRHTPFGTFSKGA